MTLLKEARLYLTNPFLNMSKPSSSESWQGVILTLQSYPRHSMFAIYAYIDPQNHPNVGIYGSPMECLGIVWFHMV